MIFSRTSAVALLASVAAPSMLASADAATIGTLRFIGAATISNEQQVDGTLVGGLSGLDYDAASDSFVVISDDKSDKAPARFYTVKLKFSFDRLFSADATAKTTFLRSDGQPYPNAKAGGEVPDPEAIRIDPENGNIWFTSEGDRKLGLSPFLRVVDKTGKQTAEIAVPAMFGVNKDKESGARNNLAFEALSFAADGKSVWLGMEEAIYEDGPVATPTAGAVTRFMHLDKSGKLLGEVAYPIDAIPAAPGAGKFADNGVSDFLAIDDSRLIVIERAGVQAASGAFKDYIRLYEADVSGATDVSAIPTLVGATYQPVKKRLILDLDKVDIGYVDNIEGISWGPKLENGHQSLILVSDNNFNPEQRTQFLAFDVVP